MNLLGTNNVAAGSAALLLEERRLKLQFYAVLTKLLGRLRVLCTRVGSLCSDADDMVGDRSCDQKQ